MLKVSNTMNVKDVKDKKIHYIIIKIGDKFYSTSYEDIKSGNDISLAKEQLAETKGIGKQKNTWIKGFFTETNNHNKLLDPIPFELNIYEEN
jgi:ERCC4-type nuclease